MAIWDKLLRKVINPIVKSSIKELEVDSKLQKFIASTAAMSEYVPIDGVGPINKPIAGKIFPRGVSFRTLRDFSLLYPILRACVNYRKRQITQLQWDIAPREVIINKEKKEKLKKEGETVRKFFRYPTGDPTLSFRIFTNKIIEDLMVLDAVAIYRRKNKKGDMYGYLPIDATTIELILNKDGTTPPAPQEAYIQKIDGRIVAKLSTDELIYKLMNPRTDTPYGLSSVEALVITVTTALKLSAFNLSFLTEGNVPEGFVELPRDVADSPEQLQVWQQKWDAMFSGDPRFQRKIKFLPEGMKWSPVRKPEDMQFDRFEKWLLLNTCFDDITEILTNDGWKLFKDLASSDLVATRNTEGILEYQKPTDYQSYYYEGSMIAFKSKMIDLLVTPDHNMLTTYNHGQERGFSEYKFEQARNLLGKDGHLAPITTELNTVGNDRFILPGIDYLVPNVNGTYRKAKSDGITVSTVDFARFLGLWLADGWARGSKGGKKPGTKNGKYLGYTIGVSAKGLHKKDKVEEILNSIPVKWNKDKTSYLANNMSLWKYLSELGNVYTKRVPREFLNYSKEVLEALWEGYLLGDGYVAPHGQKLVISCNRLLLDDFQEVLFKIGRSGSIRLHSKAGSKSIIRGRDITSTQDCYVMTARKSKHIKLKAKQSSYSGMVYDVTVPNHTIYVRRGSKPVWTGNCSVMEVPPQSIGFQFERGKGATEAEWEIGKERGLFPTANFLKEIFDQIIQEDLKQEELEFVWTNINPTNREEEAIVFAKLVGYGAVSVDEWRLGEGMEPIGLPHYITTPTGPIFVKDLISASEEGKPLLPASYLRPGSGGLPTPKETPPPVKGNPNEKPPKPEVKPGVKPSQVASKIKKIADEEIVEELKKWKRAAKNDFKKTRGFRSFSTELIDSRTKKLITEGLELIKTKEDLDQLFNPFINQESSMLKSMIDLYEEVKGISDEIPEKSEVVS